MCHNALRDRSLFMPRGGLEEFRFILKKFWGPPLENKAIFQDPPTISLKFFKAPPPNSYTPNTHTPAHAQTLNWYIGG